MFICLRFLRIQNHSTPLHWACSDRHLEVVRELLGASADPNLADQVHPLRLLYEVMLAYNVLYCRCMWHIVAEWHDCAAVGGGHGSPGRDAGTDGRGR